MNQRATTPPFRDSLTHALRRAKLLITGLTVVVIGAALVACDSGNYAWGLRPSDVVGTWRSAGSSPTELTLSEDGTFTATAWPSVLQCAAQPFPADDALERSPRIDESGTWSFTEGTGSETSGGFLAGLTLRFTETCIHMPAPLAYFRVAEDGTVSMCFPLDGDPDTFSASRALRLLKTPFDEGSVDEACR